LINTFAQIDDLASAGRSPWHRASAFPKMLLTLLFVVLAVSTPSWVLVLLPRDRPRAVLDRAPAGAAGARGRDDPDPVLIHLRAGACARRLG
jgi:hypothetical protein